MTFPSSVPPCPHFPSASSISPDLSVGRSRFFRRTPCRVSRLSFGPLGIVTYIYVPAVLLCQAKNEIAHQSVPARHRIRQSNRAHEMRYTTFFILSQVKLYRVLDLVDLGENGSRPIAEFARGIGPPHVRLPLPSASPRRLPVPTKRSGSKATYVLGPLGSRGRPSRLHQSR